MCRWLLAAAAIVVMLAASGAVHDVRADALADARKAVDGSDYPTAQTTLERALKAGVAGPDELAEIYKLTGIVAGALGDGQAATDAFAKWLSLDPKGSLPVGTSPKIMRPFTAAQDQTKKRGHVEAKVETEDDPPAVTLVIVSDPQKLIVGAKVHFRVDKRAEQTLAADGDGRIKVELETGKRLDLRVHGIDQYGNRVVELGSKDVPIVITSSGTNKKLPEDDKVAGPVTPASPRAWYAQWWVWGVASVVASGVTGYFAYRTSDELSTLESLNANSYAHTWSEAQAVESDARRDLVITNVSAGVAGVFAVGGLLLYFTQPTARESSSAVSVTPMVGGGAVSFGGHF